MEEKWREKGFFPPAIHSIRSPYLFFLGVGPVEQKRTPRKRKNWITFFSNLTNLTKPLYVPRQGDYLRVLFDLILFNSHDWPRPNFSVQYQSNIKQASHEYKGKNVNKGIIIWFNTKFSELTP